MGTARVEKILIATHLDERDELLRRLQEEGILHISKFEEERPDKKQPETVAPDAGEAELKQTLVGLNQAIGFLSGYAQKRKGGVFAGKPSLPAEEFRRRVDELDLPIKLKRVSQLSQAASRLETEERQLHAELETLTPWRPMKHPPCEYTNLKQTHARFVFVSSKEEKEAFAKSLKPLTTNYETVRREGETEYAVILFPTNEEEAVEDTLKATGVKMIQLSGFAKPPTEEIKVRRKLLAKIGSDREKLTSQAREMSTELSGLQTALDLYGNEGLIREQHEKMLATEKAGLIEGWIRSSDRKRLKEIVAGFEASEVRSIKARKGERMPVALRNPPWLKPFELILNMYGTPNGREADPTPLMAPFFALFFALCISDAGYGIVIAAATAWLIWGRRIRNNLIWILFYGGVLTIFTGAVMGSWFGNMPDMLEIPWLVGFRDALTWFDPLKNPMPFFYISLGLGYFQMMFGMAVDVIDGIRTRDYGSALFETLPWFLIYLGIPLMIATSISILPKILFTPLLIVVIASLAVSFVLSNRPGPTSVTSAILLWAVMTAAFLAAAKVFGLLALPGIILKALLIGTIAALWLYTVFKGLSEKTMRAAGVIFGVLGLAAIILYVAGVIQANLFLAAVFVLNLIFTFSVLKGWASRIVWGAYSIYSNTTGVLGIILSYVRLMALGMVTAGIAMAFNQIAWMLAGIPVVSVILMLIVLVIGHVYNLAISGLSGFVHTLRLQYVEYFPRFFAGGGARFEPFELKTRYVKVTRRT